MNNIFSFFNLIWLVVFAKQLLFWLWLWQLKEYHLGRLKAHFETKKTSKIISSFWRLKFPKFTPKILIIVIFCFIFEFYLLYNFFFVKVFILTLFLIPLFVLFFQVPSFLWRRIVIQKARAKRKKMKNLLVIGITGSFGKTSTKEFLYAILSEKFKVLKTKEHRNSEVGISQCILNDLKPEHEIFICEMGAYNIGGIRLLCDMAKPKIGILTGINEQHMSTFGSLENIIKAKYELIESLPEDGLAFFNAKNKYCFELYQKTTIRKKLYGEHTDFLGEENFLAAEAVARELEMTEEEIKNAGKKIKNKFGGLEIKKSSRGLNIADATYSANPDGILAHLEYFRNFPGKKVIVMPCLIELGSSSAEIHKKIGQKIGEICNLAIITTEDRFKDIKEGAGDKAVLMENPEEIFKKIKSFCKKDDLVILESRVPGKLVSLLSE